METQSAETATDRPTTKATCTETKDTPTAKVRRTFVPYFLKQQHFPQRRPIWTKVRRNLVFAANIWKSVLRNAVAQPLRQLGYLVEPKRRVLKHRQRNL